VQRGGHLSYTTGMEDYRIEVPRNLRNAGILIGVLMMVAGLFLAWRKVEYGGFHLPPTGYKGGGKNS
jgi:hypothetical protein